MSTCLYPPVNNQPTDAQQDNPLDELGKMGKEFSENFVSGFVNKLADKASQHIPQFDTDGREWCYRCEEYLFAGHLHKGSPEHKEMSDKAREHGMCFDGMQRHAENPRIKLSPEYMQSCIQELKENVKHLFRMVNDVSELRHETNQNEGCTRAKVENDLIPCMDNMLKRVLTIENFIGQNYKSDIKALQAQLIGKDVDLWNRVKKLEQTTEMSRDTISCVDSAYDKCVEEIYKRLEKLESHKNLHDYIPLSHEHGERISQLEKDIKFIHSALNAQIGISRAPHKCPVCYGTGFFDLVSLEDCIKNNGCKTKQCVSCEGKGIVWG